MVLLLIVLGAVAIVSLVLAWFLLGFRLGAGNWQTRLLEAQLESAKAGRQLHDLTREAFVAMAEHAQRAKESSDGR